MKGVFALILLGLSCAASSPSCSDSELNKCRRTQRWQRGYPETAVDLVDFCKDILEEFDCQLDFTERCPNTLIGAFRKSLQDYRNFFGRVCDESDPLNKKFPEKAACLNKNRDSANINCERIVKEQEYCKKTEEVLKCSEEEINKICGRDGAQLYTELFKTDYSRLDVFCVRE